MISFHLIERPVKFYIMCIRQFSPYEVIVTCNFSFSYTHWKESYGESKKFSFLTSKYTYDSFHRSIEIRCKYIIRLVFTTHKELRKENVWGKIRRLEKIYHSRVDSPAVVQIYFVLIIIHIYTFFSRGGKI